MPPSAIRPFRHDHNHSLENESSTAAESVPFLTQEQSFDCGPVLEDGISSDSTTSGHPDALKSAKVACSSTDDGVECPCCYHKSTYLHSQRRWAWNPFGRICGSRRPVSQNGRVSEKDHISRTGLCPKPRLTTPLRRILRLLAVALMLLYDCFL